MFPKWVDTSTFQQAEKIQLIRGGSDYFDTLVDLIEHARFEIHFQVYILQEDQTGRRILESLKQAASRGVKVFMVLDDYGSSISETTITTLTEQGIQFKHFRPVIRLNNMEFGRRLHHKVVVIDGTIGVVGGINVADRYNDVDGIPAWLDFALLIEGPTADALHQRCVQIWEPRHQIIKRLSPLRISESIDQDATRASWVKMNVNDWLRRQRDVTKSYRRAINHAQKDIYIIGSYFLPGRRMRYRLRKAAARGVRVHVVLTHVSDVPFAKAATEYLYRWLFRNRFKVYEWKPTVLHAKVALIDDYWATVGSFNINFLSAYESIELNLEVVDREFGSQFKSVLVDIIENECEPIHEEDFEQRYSWRRKSRNWISYFVVRYAMRTLNIFSKKPTKY